MKQERPIYKKRLLKKLSPQTLPSAEMAYRALQLVEKAGLTLVDNDYIYENCFKTQNEIIARETGEKVHLFLQKIEKKVCFEQEKFVKEEALDATRVF